MATNFINNLSNTYRGSPSLQNQFATEQDYLDLFDNNKVTPAMAQAYISVDDTSGIKSIINKKIPIINQSGDRDGPPKGPTTGFSSQGAPYGNAKGGMHNYDDDDDGLGFKDALGLAFGGPFGYATGKIGQWAFNKTKQKINDYIEAQREKKEKELQEEIARDNEAAANRARVEAYTGKSMSAYRQSRPRSEQSFTGHGKSGMGRDPDDKMAKGGLIRSYFKGGLVSLRGK